MEQFTKLGCIELDEVSFLNCHHRFREELDELTRLQSKFADQHIQLQRDLESLQEMRLFGPRLRPHDGYAGSPNRILHSFYRRSHTLDEHQRTMDLTKRVTKAAQSEALCVDTFLDWHQLQMGQASPVGGRWKETQVVIPKRSFGGSYVSAENTVVPDEVAEMMERLFARFHRLWKDVDDCRFELSSVLALDILTVHPFSDGNGRMARVVLMFHLLKCGFNNWTFISMEAEIARVRETYLQAIYDSRINGQLFVDPWVKFCFELQSHAYYRFAEIAKEITSLTNQSRIIQEKLNGAQEPFSYEDMRCDEVSSAVLNLVLSSKIETAEYAKTVRDDGSMWFRRLET